MTLLPTLTSELVDLAGMPSLTDIEEDDGALVIGAMTTRSTTPSITSPT